MRKRSPERDLDERMSLHWPDPEDVLRALLRVDPDDPPEDPPAEDEDRPER